MRSRMTCWTAAAGVWVCSVLAPGAVADDLVSVPTTFTYQGFLKDGGAPANGSYDFRFRLCSDSDCAATTSSYVTIEDQTVTNGLFTLILDTTDFGELSFKLGLIWMEVGVRPGSSDPNTPYALMAPRQQVTAAPYAQTSGSVFDPLFSPDTSDLPAVFVSVIGEAPACFFEIFNVASAYSAIKCQSNGTGSVVHATAIGSGPGMRSTVTGTGRAGLFEITNAANTSDAMEVTHAGGGRAVRAFSTSGIGLVAESTSSFGLRAQSTTGTALDVVGSSAFSGTAAFNSLTPFSVPLGSAEIANLNAARLNGNNGAFYRNAANLTGTLPDGVLCGTYTCAPTFSNASNSFSGAFSGNGTGLLALNASNLASGSVPDVRLSSNVALLGPPLQTFTGPRTFGALATFNAQASFNARMVATVSDAQPALDVTNTGGPAAELDGDVHVTGLLTRAYTVGTSNRVGPIAYGSVDSAGTLLSGTPNVSSVSWNGVNTRYEITISGHTYTNGGYCTSVTPVVTGAGTASPIATTSANAGQLIVRINEGNLWTQRAFHFVVYRP